MAEHSLICMICKGTHILAECPIVTNNALPAEELRRLLTSGSIRTHWRQGQGTVCDRCEALNLIQFLQSPPPWKSQAEFDNGFKDKSDHVKKLGPVLSTKFWADCPICCSILSLASLPQNTEQQIYLVPDWTISRLSGELGVVTMDTIEKQQYGTCLLVVLEPSQSPLSIRIVAHRGDALCLLEQDLKAPYTLGGRFVPPEIDADRIHGWVRHCEKMHDESCLPVHTEDLGAVRLLDVKSRQIVKYPGPHCRYIALSYVWGNVSRDKYKLGDTIKTVTKTLEDAIKLTASLAIEYIWIDSICIDQNDPQDIKDQVDRMWSIYRGAWITIIAVSGSSADTGLERLSKPKSEQQVQFQYQGKTIVSLGPTLSMQIWSTPWGKRAWTLQEGLLSPRCLYLTDQQMYFDCSSMQCSESLDESRSWAHNLTPSSNPTKEGFVTWMLRQAGAGALRIPLDWPSRRLEHWGEKLNLYSYREMTYQTDAIRAFSGILQRLQTIYPQGFFCGLPIEDFDWALTWAAQGSAITRRAGFPSWSWSGWKGAMFFGQPLDVKQTRRIPTCLSIQRYEAGKLIHVFQSKNTEATEYDGPNFLILHDPVHKAWQNDEVLGDWQARMLPTAEGDGLLFITAICFHFIPDFSLPQTKTHAQGQLQRFAFVLEDNVCFLRIYSMDKNITGRWEDGKWAADMTQTKQTFILLARDHIQGHILHKLMWIDWIEPDLAERRTILELLIPLDQINLLDKFGPQKRRFVLR